MAPFTGAAAACRLLVELQGFFANAAGDTTGEDRAVAIPTEAGI